MHEIRERKEKKMKCLRIGIKPIGSGWTLTHQARHLAQFYGMSSHLIYLRIWTGQLEKLDSPLVALLILAYLG